METEPQERKVKIPSTLPKEDELLPGFVDGVGADDTLNETNTATTVNSKLPKPPHHEAPLGMVDAVGFDIDLFKVKKRVIYPKKANTDESEEKK